MRIIYAIVAIILFIVAGYIIDIIDVVNKVVWSAFASVGVEKIDLGVDYKTSIYVPFMATGAILIVVAVVIAIAQSIKERR